jgi:hypothetical protein
LVTDVLIPVAKGRLAAVGTNVSQITSRQPYFAHFVGMTTAPQRRHPEAGNAVMKARFKGNWALASRANLALALLTRER